MPDAHLCRVQGQVEPCLVLAQDRFHALALGDVGLQLLLQVAQIQVRADARRHLLDPNRLGNEIGRAQFQTLDLLGYFGGHGNEQDRDVVGDGIGFQPAADLKSVHFRQANVQQDQVWQKIADALKRRPRIQRDQHFETDLLQIVEQHLEIGRLVIHHQDCVRFIRHRDVLLAPALPARCAGGADQNWPPGGAIPGQTAPAPGRTFPVGRRPAAPRRCHPA